jgi:hypothetical protein
VTAVLESVFGLKLDLSDEPSLVTDDRGAPLMLVQTESSPGEIETSVLKRLALARERRGLPGSFPAVLIINSDATVADVALRSHRIVSPETVQRARALNIVIVRTIDLLFLIKHLENQQNKKERLTKLLLSGGGWLKADVESHDLIF